MNRMKFMPFGTDKFTRKGFFGGSKESEDSTSNVSILLCTNEYDDDALSRVTFLHWI